MHIVTPSHDHCDGCNCCVKNLHFHDFTCINASNQASWAIVEFVWLYLIYATWQQMLAYHVLVAGDMQVSIAFLFPVLFEDYYQSSSYLALGVLIFLFFFTLHQFLLCLEVFGIMFMYRTFKQVNNTEKYPHLYRLVKLKDGTLRNKEIRVF